MKRIPSLGLALAVALATVGCSTQSSIRGHSAGYAAPRRAPTYALAVTVHGALQPTPQQWASIQAKIADELYWRGALLVTDLALAERIIRLDFKPNPNDPETSGQLVLLGVRLNPYYGTSNSGILASSASFPSYSFSQLMGLHRGGWWGANNYYSGDYYNFYGPWENGYTASVSVATAPKPPPTPTPSRRHERSDRELCPPDALHPLPRSSPTYVRAEAPATLSSGFASAAPAYTSPEPTRGRWTGERSAWRTEAAARTADALGAHTARSDRSGFSRAERSASSSSDSGLGGGGWRSRNDYGASSSGSSSSGGSMSASSSHVSPVYNSPSPSYSSSSSSSSSGSLSTGSYSAASSGSSSAASASSASSSPGGSSGGGSSINAER
jgi:hypothetical protein